MLSLAEETALAWQSNGFLDLGCFWRTLQMGAHYFSRHLTAFLMWLNEICPHRGLEWSQLFMISLTLSLCWENCLLIEHYFCGSPLFEASSPTPFLASNCGGGIRKLNFCQIWLLTLPSALLFSNCKEVDDELTLGLLWIYTSRGGSCIKYLMSNPGILRQNSLFAFYKTESIITFTNCSMSTFLL